MKEFIKTLVTYYSIFGVVHLSFAQTYTTYTGTDSNITTHEGSNISFFGDLNNDGNFDELGGTVHFTNEEERLNITGKNSPHFFEMIVNAPHDLFLDSTSHIHLNTELSEGYIITPKEYNDTSLHFSETNMYTCHKDELHIDGYISYTGNNSFYFPIGNKFRTRGIELPAGASINTTKAAYFYEDPNTPSTFPILDTDIRNDDLSIVSNFEFWDLDGNTPTTVTLTWDELSNFSSLFPNNEISKLTIAGWSTANKRWENLGKTNMSTENKTITSDTFIPNDYEAITFAKQAYGIDDRLEIFNGIFTDNTNTSPNAFFRIRGINSFPENNLKIFNRWGALVYEKDHYTYPGDDVAHNPDDVFTGIANKSNKLIKKSKRLPDGTYYYILTLTSELFGQQERVGYLYLSSSKKTE